MQLRPHQINAINNVYSAIREGHNKVVLAATTSFGKTVVAAKFCQDAVDNGIKTLVLVHLEPLIEQTNDKLWSAGIRPGFIKSGYEENFDAPVQIASVQTLAQRDTWRHLNFGLIIYDECLSGDTLVMTSKGLMRIDDINIVGLSILTFNENTEHWEWKKCLKQINKGAQKTIRVKTSFGEIECTPDHKILTTSGWKQACQLKPGDKLLNPLGRTSLVYKILSLISRAKDYLFQFPCKHGH